MDFETYMDICYGVQEEITAPDEEIPPYDPYLDELDDIEYYQSHEDWIDAQIRSWIMKEESE